MMAIIRQSVTIMWRVDRKYITTGNDSSLTSLSLSLGIKIRLDATRTCRQRNMTPVPLRRTRTTDPPPAPRLRCPRGAQLSGQVGLSYLSSGGGTAPPSSAEQLHNLTSPRLFVRRLSGPSLRSAATALSRSNLAFYTLSTPAHSTLKYVRTAHPEPSLCPSISARSPTPETMLVRRRTVFPITGLVSLSQFSLPCLVFGPSLLVVGRPSMTLHGV